MRIYLFRNNKMSFLSSVNASKLLIRTGSQLHKLSSLQMIEVNKFQENRSYKSNWLHPGTKPYFKSPKGYHQEILYLDRKLQIVK